MAKENSRPQNFVGMNPQQMREEEEQALAILAQLEGEQAQVAAMLAERKNRVEELKIEVQGIQSSASKSTKQTVATVSSESARALQAKVMSVDDEIRNYSALLEGLQRFSGVKLVDTKLDPNGDISMRLKIAKVEVMFTLDSSRQLSNIKLLNAGGKAVDVLLALRTAKTLAPPNDIRQAIFSISAQQQAADVFRRDLSELKKQILVRHISDLAAQLTLRTGVIVDIECDPCYPEVPRGISIKSAIGVGGWSADELDAIKDSVNRTQCRTLQDALATLIQKLDEAGGNK